MQRNHHRCHDHSQRCLGYAHSSDSHNLILLHETIAQPIQSQLGRGKVAFRAGSDGGERGIRTLDGITPKPHFQFAPEEGSEGLLAPPEVRCRCLEDS